MFEITLTHLTHPVNTEDLDSVLVNFLYGIGYLRRDEHMDNLKGTVAYRLFRDCFLLNPEKYWPPEELMNYLGTSRTTLYRHLNRLKDMGFLEEKMDGKKKLYRFHHGDIRMAWTYVETNITLTLQSYKKYVENISSLKQKT